MAQRDFPRSKRRCCDGWKFFQLNLTSGFQKEVLIMSMKIPRLGFDFNSITHAR
ncbi:predicted protein [Plenodomus lingam JN3]|uniref:Predicted protein n=1 Tax=Leptosphaeria maculans (strain JN3 / isolate v23.1.3 / race Av1-4-5-6-7-8) TaxID=985895 RepID=E5ACE0_LEPMJ|nr:predicted protein [Plenodomus lingam JN3]CBY02142.1 predicted protein [Plenodomus lingam JN3]